MMTMEKICWSDSDWDVAEFVILGIPDESQSHAFRKGTEDAPDVIRRVSNERDAYIRDDQKILGRPVKGLSNKVHDMGNITRNDIKKTMDKIYKDSKTPISIGGDHSITTSLVRAAADKFGTISLVYFDAHPDMVSSTTNYYGSVVNDLLPCIDPETSFQIGIRTPEQEELDNIKKTGINVITPFDIAEQSLREISTDITERLGKTVYISFDMDCIDPAHAPGVSVPVPMGLNSTDAIYLLESIVRKRQIVGFDIMEVCPRFDVNDRTSHLASRIISEIIHT